MCWCPSLVIKRVLVDLSCGRLNCGHANLRRQLHIAPMFSRPISSLAYSTLSGKAIFTSVPARLVVFKLNTIARVASLQARAMASKIEHDLEAFGKAKSGSGSPSKERGDCPFSQRIYIELEEKKLPYEATYIEEGPNKPDWFMAKNPSGLIPVLRDGDIWIQDSDKIADYLEKNFPDTSLKTPSEYKELGGGIFQAFTSWLKSKDADDNSKEEVLKELSALDHHLSQHGPFIAGEQPTDSDFALIPKLHHMRVELDHYYGFKIPKEYSHVNKYIELLESRPSFQKTNSPDDMIIEGWRKKFDLPAKSMGARIEQIVRNL